MFCLKILINLVKGKKWNVFILSNKTNDETETVKFIPFIVTEKFLFKWSSGNTPEKQTRQSPLCFPDGKIHVLHWETIPDPRAPFMVLGFFQFHISFFRSFWLKFVLAGTAWIQQAAHKPSTKSKNKKEKHIDWQVSFLYSTSREISL